MLVLVLLVTGCSTNSNGLKGDYTWNKGTENLYKDVSWNPITETKLSGLALTDKITENKTEKCISDYELPYLRTEGGMCGIGYWLEINENNVVTKVDSLEKLKAKFAPIDSELEAMSYVAVVTGDLYIYQDVLKGNTAGVEDGYLVNLTHNNTFGCGQHEPTGAVYKVTKEGTIENMAFEKEPLSLKPEMCVD